MILTAKHFLSIDFPIIVFKVIIPPVNNLKHYKYSIELIYSQ